MADIQEIEADIDRAETNTSLVEDLAIAIETLPNFRRVDAGGKLYRSARPDHISHTDCEKVCLMGIRTILDLRSKSEYDNADGEKLFDHSNCQILEVDIQKEQDPLQKDDVPVMPVMSNSNPTSVALFENGGGHIKTPKGEIENGGITEKKTDGKRKRYLLNCLGENHRTAVWRRIPFHKQFLALVYLTADVILRTNHRYMMRYLIRETLNPQGLLSSYIDMLEYSGKQFCLALRILSDPVNLPAVISCAMGKDRTGIVVALVLSLLEKSDEYIVQDYVLSEEGLEPIRSRVREEMVEGMGMDESFIHAKRETMEGLLKYIHDKYGTVPDYLEANGFTKEDQRKLVKTLQE